MWFELDMVVVVVLVGCVKRLYCTTETSSDSNVKEPKQAGCR